MSRNLKATLEAVGADLAKDDVTLVVPIGSHSTRGDAWCDAVEKHGEQIALIHLKPGFWSGGRPLYRTSDGYVAASVLYVSYPWEDTKIGKRIHDALVTHRLTVEWDGDGTSAIAIHLSEV